MFVGTERAALRSWESRPYLSATGKPTVRRYTLGTNACPRCQTFSSVNLCTNAPPATYSCCSNGFHLQLLTFNFGPLSCLQDSGFEFADFGIKGGGFEGPDQCVAGVGGIDDGVDPEARGGIARIGLMFVSGADGFDQLFFLFFVDFFAFALELLQFYFGERAGCGVAAHHREARRGPGEHEARVVGFAAHGVISSAETAAANYRNLWHDAVRYGVYHFRAGADDAAPFRVFADHEAVYVVQKNQWDAILVAIENEARRFFRGLGINHPAKFDTLLVRAARQCLHVFFLIGDNADGPAANAGVSAKKSFAVLRAVLFELARIDGARDDLLHVILFRWIA